MSNTLVASGINDEIVSPFKGVIKNYWVAYWIIGIVMMILSWFFWPSPAVALVGALFLPIAIKAGLPAMGVAISMNLFGHGIALSSDYIIQAAPKLTAGGAGIPIASVISASIPLVITMGVVTTTVAFYYLRKDIKAGSLLGDSKSQVEVVQFKRSNAYFFKKSKKDFSFINTSSFRFGHLYNVYCKTSRWGCNRSYWRYSCICIKFGINIYV